MSTQAGGTSQGADFTPEQLLRQAQGNATGTVLITIAYLKERGLPVEDWVAFIGQQFARGWGDPQGRGAADVARIAALNVVSVGGELVALSGDDTRAEAVVSGWPPAAMLELAGISRDDADAFNDAFGPIAAHLGLRFAWRREGDRVVLAFAR
jgi:hypothetical protein